MELSLALGLRRPQLAQQLLATRLSLQRSDGHELSFELHRRDERLLAGRLSTRTPSVIFQ